MILLTLLLCLKVKKHFGATTHQPNYPSVSVVETIAFAMATAMEVISAVELGLDLTSAVVSGRTKATSVVVSVTASTVEMEVFSHLEVVAGHLIATALRSMLISLNCRSKLMTLRLLSTRIFRISSTPFSTKSTILTQGLIN